MFNQILITPLNNLDSFQNNHRFLFSLVSSSAWHTSARVHFRLQHLPCISCAKDAWPALLPFPAVSRSGPVWPGPALPDWSGLLCFVAKVAA